MVVLTLREHNICEMLQQKYLENWYRVPKLVLISIYRYFLRFFRIQAHAVKAHFLRFYEMLQMVLKRASMFTTNTVGSLDIA
jgi:hypothetical protein